jgi:nitrogenase molybdenum-iron protein alpha/beta subunit
LDSCRQADDAELSTENTILAVVSAEGSMVIRGDDVKDFVENFKEPEEAEDVEMEEAAAEN